MTDTAFELDIAPKKKKGPQVAGWMLAVNIIAFLGLAAVLSLVLIEKMYMRGELTSETDPRASEVLLPRPLN